MNTVNTVEKVCNIKNCVCKKHATFL